MNGQGVTGTSLAPSALANAAFPPPFGYHGGPVLAHVRIVVVLWGPYVDSTVTPQLGSFYGTLTDSAFLDLMAEYRTPTQPIERGTYAGTYTITPSVLGSVIDDSSIGPELAAQIAGGALPAPDSDTLYMIHFPPSVTIHNTFATVDGPQTGTSCVDFCAYHFHSRQNVAGQDVDLVYGVMPDFSTGPCSSACRFSNFMLDSVTTAAAHEVAEAITDPLVCDPRLTTCQTAGWYPEIGDACEGQSSVPLFQGGLAYLIPRLYSASRSTCHNQLGFLASAPLAASFHTAVRSPTGSLRSWGDDELGQIGIGTVGGMVLNPVSSRIASVVSVTAERFGQCALTGDQSVFCWGFGRDGALGNGATNDSALPVKVSGVAGAVAIASGYDHACALMSTGFAGDGLSCWGINNDGELGVSAPALAPSAVPIVGGGGIAITAGGFHTCALTLDRTVVCWGAGTDGQLGNGAFASSAQPVQVLGLPGPLAITAGERHTCALSVDGTVRCWGLNGQLGNVTTFSSATPVPVFGLSTAVGIASFKSHTCAVLADKTVRCWGDDSSGQLGDGGAGAGILPVQVSNLSNVRTVATGANHSCALNWDGSVACWGQNANGQLGNGTTNDSSVPVLANVSAVVPIPVITTMLFGLALLLLGLRLQRAGRRSRKVANR
jgi:alpha-tubulin suppressor-like RCC1 family protein